MIFDWFNAWLPKWALLIANSNLLCVTMYRNKKTLVIWLSLLCFCVIVTITCISESRIFINITVTSVTMKQNCWFRMHILLCYFVLLISDFSLDSAHQINCSGIPTCQNLIKVTVPKSVEKSASMIGIFMYMFKTKWLWPLDIVPG